MARAKVEALLEMGEEAFEEAVFVAEPEVLEAMGYAKVLTPAATYAEARAKALARVRERGFAPEGVYGAKAVTLTKGREFFVVLVEVGF
ncbi:MAG: hypothetical protein ACOYB2_10710 [Limnohabitans sp.]